MALAVVDGGGSGGAVGRPENEPSGGDGIEAPKKGGGPMGGESCDAAAPNALSGGVRSGGRGGGGGGAVGGPPAPLRAAASKI